jgi:hypothetical protein
MGTEANKCLVALFNSYFEHSDIGAILALMTDDAEWWVNARSDLHSGATLRSKADMADVCSKLYASLDGGLTLQPLVMIAEGVSVVAEVRSHAVTKSGKVYDNGYLFLFTVRDGKLASVREYTDLLFATATFGDS